MIQAKSGAKFRRRLFVVAVAGFTAIASTTGFAAAQVSSAAQKIADHFSSVKTMTGEFVQFGPRGEQTAGTFTIERPGKIRFDYEPPAAFKVISDGSHVLLNNQRLKTYETYPLSKTPLKMLLDDRIDLSNGKVESVREEDDLTTIVLSDKSVFGNSKLTMMFDPATYDLRQWTITDAQGKDTTVMIFNVKDGVKVNPDMFKIDYRKVTESAAKGLGNGR